MKRSKMRDLKSAILGNWRLAAARAAGISAVDSARQPHSTSVRSLSLADQWLKLTSVLVRAQRGVEHAKSLQTAAAQKLDLAQYGLQTLVDDLSTVMTVPGRRQAAPVHVLGSNQPRAHIDRPAAYAA